MKANYDMTKAKRGAVVAQKGKTRITIYLDDEVIAGFKQRGEALGKGYQTLINEALSAALLAGNAPVTVSTLRQVLREELRAA
ncbi:MAG: BrnA antitoxin family protein [Nitrosomonadales bacterium]|nr:BrnA antitoxin family protein [Nitrosomonadales bacterium]